MKPSLSLILFTVSSGAGFGLFVLLVVINNTGWGAPMSEREVLVAGALSLALVTGGLISSTFHLANPKNAIKSLNRIRTSWLSREGLFSLVFFLPAIAYLVLVGLYGNPPGAVVRFSGWLALILALTTLFCTGMIYASLKTIRQWHNPMVPANYLFIGLASGGVLLTTIRALITASDSAAATLTLALLALAALVKLIYYFWIGKPEGPTLNSATGLGPERVKLLDVGHSHGNFLTEEFGHRLAAGRSFLLRTLALVMAFLVPFAVLVVVANRDAPQALTLLALVAALSGILIERWLFLIEGHHAVNLYYGRQRT